MIFSLSNVFICSVIKQNCIKIGCFLQQRNLHLVILKFLFSDNNLVTGICYFIDFYGLVRHGGFAL